MGERKLCHCLVAMVTMCWSVDLTAAQTPVKGHLKPLGSHMPGEGVTAIGKFSSPPVFYSEFVSQRLPIWMGSALDNVNHVGLANWTDEYLREQFGSVSVNVETSKKENRKKRSVSLTLKQFLKLYKTEDLYMVHSLRDTMEDLILVPPSVSCGGFQNVLHDAVLWLGSGRTLSVLHFDQLDNLLCLFDGQKEIFLIDPDYKDAVEDAGFVQEGGYSLVDVEKVDMEKFPKFANLKWKTVKLRAGDCVYIPQGWYHQVTSRTERHLAVNLWFSHLYWFNETDCSSVSSQSHQLRPISQVGFASSNEVLRSKLVEKLHDKGIMIKQNFLSSFNSSTEERREKFFHAVDRYPDSALSWSELYGFDIDRAVLHFPDIFDLPGGSPAVPDDLVLFDPIPQPFPFGGGDVEEEDDDDEEEDEEDFSKQGNTRQTNVKTADFDSNLPSMKSQVESGDRPELAESVSVGESKEDGLTRDQGKATSQDTVKHSGGPSKKDEL